MNHLNVRPFLPLALAAFALLSACTTIPTDLGRSEVDSLLTERGRNSVESDSGQTRQELLDELTAEPLTADSAVRIALLNNPGLQATYADLGFAAADVYAAGRIRNPVFSASVLNSSVAGTVDQITLGLALSFSDLLTLPARKRLSQTAFAALRLSVGAAVLQTAAATEHAWYDYAGAQQVAAMRQQIALAANASAQMAERFYAAGNINARDLALHRAAASEARLEALDVEAEVMASRNALANMLGLSSAAEWKVQGQLPLPPPSEDELESLILLAQTSRLDLAAARVEVELQADRLGVTEWTRWLGDLELGIEREREADGSRSTGPGLSWEIPIFTQNRDQQLRAEASFRKALAKLQGLDVEVGNSVRLAQAELFNQRARIAEYRDELIPQRIESSARAQEEVNFMLMGVFELIAIKQAEYGAYQAYLQAVSDYWLARTDLRLAVGNALPGDHSGIPFINTEDLLKTSPATMDHSAHGDMQVPESEVSGSDHSQEHHHHEMHDESHREKPSNTPSENPSEEHHGDHP